MNSKFKLALLVGAITLALTGCKEEKKTTSSLNSESKTTQTTPVQSDKFKTEEQKVAYAVGVSFSELLKEALSAQDAQFDKAFVYQGFSENFADKGAITKEDAARILSEFSEKEEKRIAAEIEKAREQNIIDGKAYREQFAKQPDVKTTESGLLYKIDQAGTGEHPTTDQVLTIHYIGKFTDGREFENTYARNKSVTVPLSGMIKGWEEGFQLLRAGSKATFVIPPELAYGDNNIPGNKDYPNITPQSTLVFQVEILKISDDIDEANEAPIAEESNSEEAPAATTDASKAAASQK